MFIGDKNFPMNNKDNLILRYNSLKQEIFTELRFTHQFGLSHFALKNISEDGLPPQIAQIKAHIFEAVWGMLFLRLANFFDTDSAVSLKKFLNASLEMSIIDVEIAKKLQKELEQLRLSPEMEKVFQMRDKVIAHWDKKRPSDAKVEVSPILYKLKEIFVEAGGESPDFEKSGKLLPEAWNTLFGLIQFGIQNLP